MLKKLLIYQKCGCEVRPLQIGGAHLNLDVRGACVRPKKRSQLKPCGYLIIFFQNLETRHNLYLFLSVWWQSVNAQLPIRSRQPFNGQSIWGRGQSEVTTNARPAWQLHAQRPSGRKRKWGWRAQRNRKCGPQPRRPAVRSEVSAFYPCSYEQLEPTQINVASQ